LLEKPDLLRNLIGHGKFSKVYRIDTGERSYAVKQLKREVGSFSYLDNILNEVMILSKTNHKNIISLVGKYRNKEYYNLILEYCNGGDLKNYLKFNRALPEEVARDIIK
jgi:serine/threonine-protein kinase ULK4